MDLVDVAPDLVSVIDDDQQRAQAGRLQLTVCAVVGDAELGDTQAFAAVLIDGLLIERLQLGAHTSLRLRGPGELILPSPRRRAHAPAQAGARLALLDDRVLALIQQWPQIAVQLLTWRTQETEALEAQLAICQLPSCRDRIYSLLWLLTGRWGQSDPAGTILALNLSHTTLGKLIGAQRPTVSVALRDLADQELVIKHDTGWLLTGDPPRPDHDPRLQPTQPAAQTPTARRRPQPRAPAPQLHSTIRRP